MQVRKGARMNKLCVYRERERERNCWDKGGSGNKKDIQEKKNGIKKRIVLN